MLFKPYWIKNLMNKIKRLSVNVVSPFNFSIIFCYHIKSLMTVSNFLMIGKVIVSNWYRDLDDKLIRECVWFKINIIYILFVAKRL